jgi:hypothetical protein
VGFDEPEMKANEDKGRREGNKFIPAPEDVT